MSDNIPALIAEARATVNRGWFRADYPSLASVITRLADVLEAEHKRAESAWRAAALANESEEAMADERDRYRAEAESARKTGERILADALRYRAALIDAKQMVTIGMNADRVIERIARALNENGDTDDR